VLHLYDIAEGSDSRLTIGVAADLVETRTRYAKGPQFIRNVGLSPSGARAAFEFRGEIITVPKEKGDHRNITNTPGVHERSPAWSPDGKWIAYFSDASGEYLLHIAPQNGKGPAKTFELGGAGFYEDAKWSPDGKKLSYTDNSWSLYWIDVDSGRTHKVASEILYGPIKTLHHAWSPDSRWLAYTSITESGLQKVVLYSVEEDQSHPITEGLSDAAEPVFDDGGEYLYFFASTDAGPLRQWFAMSNADFRSEGSLYLTVLPKGIESPLAKESDEEVVENDEADTEAEAGEENAEESELEVVIDFDGLTERILTLPLDPARYYSLEPGSEHQLYYLKRQDYSDEDLFSEEPLAATLMRFDLDKRKEEALLENVVQFSLSPDKSKILVFTGESWIIADSGAKIDPTEGRVSTDRLQARIDPRAEWEQIFHEGWRVNRDYFYDPNMHGADWPALREKYAVFLPHLAVRSDLNRLFEWMCSELTVGHHFVAGGDDPSQPETVPGGLLGADFEIADERYRLAKVFGGLNWNPELRSPLTEPGVDARAGEYLLAVNGEDLRPPENLYGRFENTAEKIVEITLGPSADGEGSREVEVVPIASEAGLRNRDWVEGNLKRVHEATDDRVAYVYVPNTTQLGHTYFKRYFFPQVDKEAIIIDERHNSGGQIADYLINILRRPHISYWAMRYGKDLGTPQGAIQGPRVMLIDETAGSGGDLLPWMFRKLEMGPLIGKRTWGGLVGIMGTPILMDGGFLTAPNIGFWTENGWEVENEGVPPDIEVEQTPAEVIAGRDPQLEKAIEVILDELAKSPAIKPERPPFPVRVRP
jgi:tricorn protease